MTKYKVELARTEYLSQVIEVEANSQQEAMDIAWDRSGKWECVEADEFTNTVEVIS